MIMSKKILLETTLGKAFFYPSSNKNYYMSIAKVSNRNPTALS